MLANGLGMRLDSFEHPGAAAPSAMPSGQPERSYGAGNPTGPAPGIMHICKRPTSTKSVRLKDDPQICLCLAFCLPIQPCCFFFLPFLLLLHCFKTVGLPTTSPASQNETCTPALPDWAREATNMHTLACTQLVFDAPSRLRLVSARASASARRPRSTNDRLE